jgi:8-oxo-dGTP pyrophosphatase MutT (NUDIX family)
MSERFRPHAAAYVLLIRDGKLLMMRRFQTGWQDGNYGLPAGHLEGKETIAGTAAREAKEEIGIDIEEKDLRVVHVMHRISPEREYVDFFLVADKWSGEPTNMEESKCDDIRWVGLDDLPGNTVQSVRAGIENYQKGILFCEFGWDGKI